MRIAIVRLVLTILATLWVVAACMGITQPRTMDPLTYDVRPTPPTVEMGG